MDDMLPVDNECHVFPFVEVTQDIGRPNDVIKIDGSVRAGKILVEGVDIHGILE